MKFEIVRLEEFSGRGATIYSVIIDDESETLFDRFMEENEENHSDEVSDILKTLRAIGKKAGARIDYFKSNEGIPGDGVCALYDDPDKKLRLYCIRYGKCAVILGSGAPKPKSIIKLQDDPKLKEENYLVRKISARITRALEEKYIKWSSDGTELLGDLTFEDDE